ncbi:RNA-dependent RNA polymerase [Phytophthora condilina negative stranded RNA virus 7]|nr:RNA-dependent RNA polymerase [Phytophthora condilina negative stranded RNA virus 7]
MFISKSARKSLSVRLKGGITVDKSQYELTRIPIQLDRFESTFGLLYLFHHIFKPSSQIFLYQYSKEDKSAYIRYAAEKGVQLYIKTGPMFTSNVPSSKKLFVEWTDSGDYLLIPATTRLATWQVVGFNTFAIKIPSFSTDQVIPIYTWPTVKVLTNVYDLGGSGECLILCFMARFYGTMEIPTVKEHYDAVGLQPGQFLEDVDMQKLGHFYKCNILILRIYEGKLTFVYYKLSDSYESDIGIVNYYPYHFCLIRDLYLDDNPCLTRSFNPPVGYFTNVVNDFSYEIVVCNYQLSRMIKECEWLNFEDFIRHLLPDRKCLEYFEEVLSVDEEDEFELGSEISDEELEEINQLEMLPKNADPELLFHYLRNFGNMYSASSVDVVDAFKSVHYEICNLTLRFANEGRTLPNIFYKHYFKCRHNVFGYLCVQGMNKANLKLETDVPLSRYIESKRTPDYILHTKSEIVIYEFTVTNRYDQADFIKGGGLVDVKYQNEAELISEKEKIPCRVVIVPCVLSEYNTNEIEQLMGWQLDKGLLRVFIDVCHKNKDMLAAAYFSSVERSAGLVNGKHELKNKHDSLGIDAFFISIILRNWTWFLSYCVSLATRDRTPASVALVYDTLTQRALVELEPAKKMKTLKLTHLIEILQNHDLSGIVENLNVQEGNKIVGLSAIAGDIMITVNNRRHLERKFNYEHPMTRMSYYTKRSSKPSGYDDIITDWTDDLIVKCNQIKYDFDDEYFDKLCSHSFSKLKGSSSDKLLGNNKMTDLYIDESVEVLDDEYLLQNKNPRIKFSPKPSFMWPFVSGCLMLSDLKLNNVFLKKVSGEISGKYTQKILMLAASGKFYTEADKNEELNNISEKYSEARQTYTNFLISNNLVKKYSFFTPAEKVLVDFKRKPMIDLQKSRSALLATAKRRSLNLVKINCRGKNQMKQAFLEEMKHYQKGQKGLKGIGLGYNMKELIDYFQTLPIKLRTPKHKMELSPLFNAERSPGSEFLTDQKNAFTMRWQEFYEDHFKGTLLEQLGIFIDRLSVFLFNESMKPYNNNFVKIDNLGFQGVIVLLRGGSKSKNNTSRLFRVFFPIDEDDLKMTGYLENENYQIISMNDKFFVLTPWSQLHMDILYDGFTARERMFTSLYSAYSRIGSAPGTSLSSLTLLPHILMLNNRRKTEQIIHNLRYLIVNPLGMCANIKGIMKSFGTFNHTYLTAWIKVSLINNYKKFAKQLIKMVKTGRKDLDALLRDKPLDDLFFNIPIINTEHLTFHIYCTYLMTKAPVNNTLEQVNNLKTILEDVKNYETDHKDVQGMSDISQHINVFQYNDQAYEDDFAYDPTFCQYLGYHMSNYLRNKTTPAEMNSRWKDLMDQGITSIANSNGLRGYKKDNYFSKKGYEVVFDKVIDNLNESDLELDQMVQKYLDLDYRTACSAVKSDMIRKSDVQLNKITFHIVHKIQRGGGREIFCMDLFTKMFQNPIEMFMKYLCKQVPNEFISIPSNKRHGLIHRDFYERTPSPWIKETIRWVLDCRRWAPHSVFQKYVHFIHGMSSILPADMVEYFGAFSEKMFDKEFCTREHVMKAIDKNKTFDGLKNVLQKDKMIPGKYNMKVKFSFVMGIFNYLSTLMHAANQMVAAEVVMRNSLNSKTGLVVMDAKCHSDDSVATTYHEDSRSIRPTILIYDWLLKCSNHMLSIKKSQINKNVYLEFLSTLYLFDRFVPVVPKFVSTIPFKPTDLGYSTDVTFAASQAIELMLQGGSLDESFLMMKVSERFIQRIYNINSNNTVPYSLMGNIDCHPIELLLSGVESDIINHYLYNRERLLNVTNTLIKYKIIKKGGIEGFTITWDMSSKAPLRLKDKYRKWDTLVQDLVKKFPWTLTQCRLGNDYLQLIWYMSKLNDPKYYASMMMEPDSRLFTRVFGSYKYRCIFLQDGSIMKASDLTNILKFECDDRNVDLSSDYYEKLCNMNPYVEELHDVFRTTSLTGFDTPIGFKTKPVSMNLTSSRLDRIRLSTQEVVAYIYEPDAFQLLGKNADPKREVSKVIDFVKSMGLELPENEPELAMRMINFALGRRDPKYNLIAPVPSDEKRVEDYNGVVVYLTHNSIPNWIVDITTTRADVIDWSNKVSRGKTPKSVLDYMEIKQMKDIMVEQGVSSIDLLKFDINEKMLECFEEVPVQWRPIVYSTMKTDLQDLIDENYWTAWLKKQIKVGRNWYGAGRAIVSLPEVIIQFDLLNGVVSEIRVLQETRCELSTTSNWYLLSFLNLPGLRLATISSDVANPSKDYFGYNSKSGHYGFGSPAGFDRVFEHSLKLDVYDSGILYNTEYINFNGKYQLVNSTKGTVLVEFFNPGFESNCIDFSRYLDKAKVEKSINVPKVKEFCLRVSYDMRSEFTFKKQEIIDTIGFTSLYKIIHNNPESMSVFRGSKDPDVFYESFTMWKTTHFDFGFPSEEEIELLVDESLSPRLPPRLLRILSKMGKSTLGIQERENIIMNMYNTPKDMRLQYLLSVLGPMSSGEKTNMLVLALKSTRFYKSCKILGSKTFRIFTPLMNMIIRVVDETPCTSETLDNIWFNYARNKPKSYALRLMIARIVIVNLYTKGVNSENDAMIQLTVKLIEELFMNKMGYYLNTFSVSDPILRSVEFDVDKKMFMEMIVDVFDSLCLTEWSMTPYPKTVRTWEFPETEQYSNLVKDMTKLKRYIIPSSVTISTRSHGKKYKTKLRNSEPTPGIIDSPYVPLDEVDQEEFEAGLTYLSDPEEDLEFEEEGECPRLRFVVTPCTDRVSMMKVRGTAHQLIIKSQIVDRGLFTCYGIIKMMSKNRFENLEDFVSNYGSAYIYIGNEGKNFSIDGYNSWSLDDYNRIVKRYPSPTVQIDGEEIEKTDIIKDPMKISKLITIDNYFSRLAHDTDEKQTVTNEETEMIENTKDQLRDDFPEFEKMAKKVITGDVVEEIEPATMTTEKIIELYKKNKEIIENWSGLTKAVSKNLSSFFEGKRNFLDNMKMMTDPETLGQFNTLYGNKWNDFENDRIRMTKLSKRVKIERALYQISRLQANEKEKYSKLLFLTSVLLAAIPEVSSPDLEDHHFSRMIDELFDVNIDIDIPFDIMTALEPNAGSVHNVPDLDRIFGRER